MCYFVKQNIFELYSKSVDKCYFYEEFAIVYSTEISPRMNLKHRIKSYIGFLFSCRTKKTQLKN